MGHGDGPWLRAPRPAAGPAPLCRLRPLRQNFRMSVPAVSTGFALAKIQPPRPRIGLVERPALERALGPALQQHRLVLLLAPAGYGKTAALTRQIRQLPPGCALAWVSADEDDHLQRFLACLTAALEPHDLPWRVAPDALATLAQGEDGLRGVAGEIVSALAAAEVERGLIVIDDAHRLADPRVFELLQLLLDDLPLPWAMAIASRVEPALSLSRLRAAGELAEFRQYDLRFNEDEVAALLDTVPPSVRGPVSAHELLERTGGWAAGLRLSLSARPGAAGRGGDAAAQASTQRHLFDYLASEVLDEMPIVLHDFLLRCAVLPELTARRCAKLSGRADAAQLLAQVERRGLFVSALDAAEPTLRLHDLFRDFLEDRLQRNHADEVPGLLCLAAEDEPDLVRAVGYLARAGAWSEAAWLLAERGPALLPTGGVATLAQLLGLFPAEAFDSRPELHWLRGLVAFPGFDFETMRDSMLRAAEGFDQAGYGDESRLALAYAYLAMLNTAELAAAREGLDRLASEPSGDATAALVHFSCAWAAYAEVRSTDIARHFEAMLDALERVPLMQAWDQCFFQSFFAGMPGMNALLERFDNGAMRIAGDMPSQLRAGVMHSRAWRALARGRLDEACRWLSLADDDCRWLGLPRSVVTENRMAHMLLDALRGDRAGSEAAARACEDDLLSVSTRCNRLAHEHEVLFTHLRACWVLDEAERARRLDAALQRTVNPHEWHAAAGFRRMSRAFVALFDGRLGEARLLLQSLADDVERTSFFTTTQAMVMLADVHQRLGDSVAAAAVLQRWFAADHLDDRCGGALLAGPLVLARLEAVDWQGQLEPALQSLLGELSEVLQRARTGAPCPAEVPMPGNEQASAAGDDPELASLTEREREVLARMAVGDSNKLIARAFDLSPHTVKRHVANILGKLGVEARGQAAARWREHAASAPRS